MLKILAFILLFANSGSGSLAASTPEVCTCPSVYNLQKTGSTSSSLSYSWNSAVNGVQYRVWYTRNSDNYTSGYFYTNNLSYTFTGLSAGTYTLYFQTMCEGESSSYIGAEDVILG